MKYISNKKFYAQSVKEFGVSPQGVHWNSKRTQYKRFEIITNFIKDDIRTSSVADAGCGFAEYYNYLKTQNLFPQKYIGLDCEDIMINICKDRYPKQEFHKKNLLYDDVPNCDYYVCSGAMNIMNYEQCSLFIKRAYNASNKGFVFNFLRALTLNDVKPYEILSICDKLCKDIKYEENYLDNDFTIFMVK